MARSGAYCEWMVLACVALTGSDSAGHDRDTPTQTRCRSFAQLGCQPETKMQPTSSTTSMRRAVRSARIELVPYDNKSPAVGCIVIAARPTRTCRSCSAAARTSPRRSDRKLSKHNAQPRQPHHLYQLRRGGDRLTNEATALALPSMPPQKAESWRALPRVTKVYLLNQDYLFAGSATRRPISPSSGRRAGGGR